MSRDIDTSDLSKLSEADLKYLRDRGRLTPEQERELLGGINPEPPSGRSLEKTPHTGDVNVNRTNPTNRSGKPDPDTTKVGLSGEDLPENYEDWKVAQLEKEIEARNSEREEDSYIVPASGRKDDLIAALAEDDADQEQE